MTITVDPVNLIIESTASIPDLPVFHAALRDWEDSAEGVLYPITHTWKALALGGGAYFYGFDLVNGWRLKFIGSGPFTINGNLNGTIIDTGVQVERKTSAAYTTTAIGGSGPSASDVASAVRTELAAELARITKLAALSAIDETLVVTPTSRTAGALVQTITTNGDTTTVQ